MLPTLVALGLFVLLASLALVLGVWTWRRLWRHPVGSDPYTVLVYRHGVRGFGVFMFVAMTFVVPLFEAERPLGTALASPGFWGDILLRALIGVPVYLWGGYWWGRAMARFAGLRPTAPALHRDRPQN